MKEYSSASYDLIIVGSGAAGLSAAIYAQRYNMKILVLEGEFGGETATAGAIENYPGFSTVDGYELMKNMREQAEATGAKFQAGWAKEIKKEGDCFLLATEELQFLSKAIILAIGSRRRHLNLPREKELTGRGVHYCVTCDGPLYRGKIVAMVGGGDSSVKGINFLGEYASKIYFITIQKEPHAEPTNMERMKKLGEKVELLSQTRVEALKGDPMLESIMLSQSYRGSKELKVDGLFIEIGFDPDQTFAKQLGLELDEKGYMKVDSMMRTNIPGVMVAGDATNHFGTFKQDIAAAALGAVAATSAYEYYQRHGEACEFHQRSPK